LSSVDDLNLVVADVLDWLARLDNVSEPRYLLEYVDLGISKAERTAVVGRLLSATTRCEC
jgi:hypothetical protein